MSEEDAPVRLLVPDHPVLTVPNRITEADFDGWIEQRGSKFFTDWDRLHAAGGDPRPGPGPPGGGVAHRPPWVKDTSRIWPSPSTGSSPTAFPGRTAFCRTFFLDPRSIGDSPVKESVTIPSGRAHGADTARLGRGRRLRGRRPRDRLRTRPARRRQRRGLLRGRPLAALVAGRHLHRGHLVRDRRPPRHRRPRAQAGRVRQLAVVVRGGGHPHAHLLLRAACGGGRACSPTPRSSSSATGARPRGRCAASRRCTRGCSRTRSSWAGSCWRW